MKTMRLRMWGLLFLAGVVRGAQLVVVCGGRCKEKPNLNCDLAVEAVAWAQKKWATDEVGVQRLDLKNASAVEALADLTFDAVVVDCEDDAFELSSVGTRVNFGFSYVVLAPSSTSPRPADARLLVRLTTPVLKVADALVELAHFYGWPKIGLVHDDDPESLAMAQHFVDEYTEFNSELPVVVGDACLACGGVRLTEKGRPYGVAIHRATFNDTVAGQLLAEDLDQEATVILLASRDYHVVQRLFFAASLRKAPISVVLTAPSEASFYFDEDQNFVDVEAVLGHEGALGFRRREFLTNAATEDFLNFLDHRRQDVDAEGARWIDSVTAFVRASNAEEDIFATIRSLHSDFLSGDDVVFDSDGDRRETLDLMNAHIFRSEAHRRLMTVDLTPTSKAEFLTVGSLVAGHFTIDENLVVLFENDDATGSMGPVLPVDDPTGSDADEDDDRIVPPPINAEASSSSEKKKSSPYLDVTRGRGLMMILAIAFFTVALCIVLFAARSALRSLDRQNKSALLSSLNAFEVIMPYDPERKQILPTDDGDKDEETRKRRVVCKSGAVDAHGADVVEDSVKVQRVGCYTNNHGDGDDDEVLIYEDRPRSLETTEVESYEVDCWYWSGDVATVASLVEESSSEEDVKILPDTADPRKCWIAYDDVVQDQISDVYARWMKLPQDVREGVMNQERLVESSATSEGGVIRVKHLTSSDSSDDGPPRYLEEQQTTATQADISLIDLLPVKTSVESDDLYHDVDPACYKVIVKPRKNEKVDEEGPSWEINVAKMTQTNLRTGTKRAIRMEDVGRRVKLSWYWRENFRNLQKWKDAEVNIDGTLWVRYDSSEVQRELTALYIEAKTKQPRTLRLDAHNEITEAAPDIKYEIDVCKLWQTNLLTNFRRPVCVMMETVYTKATSPMVVDGGDEGRPSLLVLPPSPSVSTSSTKSLFRPSSSSMKDLLTPRSRALRNNPQDIFAATKKDTVMPDDIQGRDCLKLEVGMLVSVIHDHETASWSFGREIVRKGRSGRAGWFPTTCVAPASKIDIDHIPDQALQDFSFLLPPKNWTPQNDQLLVDITKQKEARDVLAYFDLDYYDPLSVLRVENLHLWRPYATKKHTIAERDGSSTSFHTTDSGFFNLLEDASVERYPVFHGTTGEAAMKICIEGFNRDFSSSSHAQHGRGPYFAVDAQHACFHTYAKPDDLGIQHVLVSRIVPGRYTKGSPGLMAPPFRDEKSHRRYDATVDDVGNPKIFVRLSFFFFFSLSSVFRLPIAIIKPTPPTSSSLNSATSNSPPLLSTPSLSPFPHVIRQTVASRRISSLEQTVVSGFT